MGGHYIKIIYKLLNILAQHIIDKWNSLFAFYYIKIIYKLLNILAQHIIDKWNSLFAFFIDILAFIIDEYQPHLGSLVVKTLESNCLLFILLS